MSRRRKAEPSPEPTLPITPMLDMAFQLLTFFIFTYHPSDLEGQMDLSLPSQNVTKAEKQSDIVPTDKPDANPDLDIKANVTVVAHTQHEQNTDGKVSGLEVVTDSGTEQVDSLEKLGPVLKKLSESVENKGSIKVQGDDRLKWSELVAVMDRCKAAGFTKISFVAPPDYRMSSR